MSACSVLNRHSWIHGCIYVPRNIFENSCYNHKTAFIHFDSKSVLARKTKNTSKFSGLATTMCSEKISTMHFSKEFEDLSIKKNILNGIAKPLDDRKLGQVIFDALKKSPEHVAQIDAETGKQTTYGEMMDRSTRLASWMKKQGISPNDRIVVCTHNQLDAYVPVFSTFFVDATLNAWNEGYTPHTMQRLMHLFEPTLIFTSEQAAGKLVEAARLKNPNARLIVLGKHPNLMSLSDIMNGQTQDEVDKFVLVNEKSPGDVAVITLTSGSSGYQKGAMLSNRLALLPDAQGIPPNAVIKYMWYSTLDWISGLISTFKTIHTQGTWIIPSANDSIDHFCQNIDKYKVNHVLAPLSILQGIAKSGLPREYDLRSLTTLLFGGSKLSKDTLSSLKRELTNVFLIHTYGMTEAAGAVIHTQCRSKHIDAAGIAIPNCQVKIVDTTSGETLGPYRKGELCVRAPSIMIGYYKNPDGTSEALDAEGWYHSNDLAYYDECGEIFIVGRIKEIMKYKSHQISPVEIEDILMSNVSVQEAAVAPSPVGIYGHRPVAFVKKVPSKIVTKEELMKLTSVLEDYKQLQEIYFVDNIPHLPSGKIARAELKEIAEKMAKNEDPSKLSIL